MLKLNGMPIDSIKTTEHIKKPPSIYSILFPKGYEILPNTTELFELEFAFYEQSIISKEEHFLRVFTRKEHLIKRSRVGDREANEAVFLGKGLK